MSIDTIQSEYIKKADFKINLKSVCKFKKYPNGICTVRLHLRL